MIISIAAYFANKIDVTNLQQIFPAKMFAPLGVVLFAFLGFTAIPEIERVLEKDKKPMKKVIITAYILTSIVYLIFTAVVIGFKGSATPEIATIALGKPFIFLGILTMFTAYLSLSIALIDTFKFDFKKSRKSAWLWTISVPLVLFIILTVTKHAAFTQVLGIGGVLSGGLTAILIMMMVKKAKSRGEIKPSYSMPYSKWILYILSAVFILAAVIEIMNLVF
jgi:amino acid permease